MVNPLFPRKVDLHRSNPNVSSTSKGLVGYGGRDAAAAPADPIGENVIMTGIACTIEARGIGRATGKMTLPGNVTTHPQWRIITVALPLYTIRDNDILIDDEGYRYQVAMNQWGILGYTLDCIRLET